MGKYIMFQEVYNKYPMKCFGSYVKYNLACDHKCRQRTPCHENTSRITSCKRASIDQLAKYLTDNEPLIREAAKERFDILQKRNRYSIKRVLEIIFRKEVKDE